VSIKEDNNSFILIYKCRKYHFRGRRLTINTFSEFFLSVCVCISVYLYSCVPSVPPGTGDVVSIMIPEPKGREVASLLERNVTVTLSISLGTRNLQKYVSRTSVVFVSISFIVLMTISLAWLVFYYIQRFRYANARDRNQVGPTMHL